MSAEPKVRSKIVAGKESSRLVDFLYLLQFAAAQPDDRSDAIPVALCSLQFERDPMLVGWRMTLEEAGFIIPYGSMTDNEERPVYSDDTLLEALKYKGGEDLSGMAQNLLRAAAAALLNAAHPEVNYPLSVAEVVNLVNNALTQDRDTMENLKDEFDTYNNLTADEWW